MTGQRPVLIMAGGTGGHIFPGLALARALRDQGTAVAWLGAAGGMEARLVPQHDIPFHAIPVSRLRGQGLATRLRAPWSVARAVWRAGAVIRRLRPRAVVSMGGFAAGPGGLAAWLLRRPLVVHEQNSVAGLTNRVLARLADTVLTGFPRTFVRGIHVGNPVRSEIAALAPPEERMASRSGQSRLLVLGGSQGARRLNEVVPASVALIPPTARPQVRHQSGPAHHETAVAAWQEVGVDANVQPFIDDMAAAYAWADLVICRAGALTIAELAAAGVGAILVPFPHAVDDHQTANARYLVSAGAAQLLPESELTPSQLAERLNALLGDGPALLAMARKARAQARPDAAAAAARYCMEAAR